MADRLEDLTRQATAEGRTIDQAKAREVLTCAVKHHRLMGDFVLQTTDGPVTVGEILDARNKWHGRHCLDPLEPEYGQPNPKIARLNLHGPGKPFVFSFAHGGTRYILERQLHEIRVAGGALVDIVERCLSTIRLDGQVFDRGGILVRVADGQTHMVCQDWLTWHLSGLVRFTKYDSRAEDWKPVDCPAGLARTLLSMTGTWDLPRLKSLITAPVILPGGRVLDRPGLDQESELYLDPAHLDGWTPLPETVTAEDLRQSIKTLWEPFRLFPFVSDVDRGGMVAAILTAIVRQGLDHAPAISFTAPARGAGKTLLAKSLCAIAGNRAEVLSYTDSPEEMRKMLFAFALHGAPVMLLDDLDGIEIKSNELNRFLTSPYISDRVLGGSTMGRAPTSALVMFTGNNIRPAACMTRRVIEVAIDPRVEMPFTREFDFDPYQLCAANRLSIVRSGLMILRAWLQSGHKAPSGRLATFEQWHDLIRGAVCWLRDTGLMQVDDPVKSIEKNTMHDPDSMALDGLLTAWEEAYGTEPRTLAQVLDDLSKPFGIDNELNAIFMTVAGWNGKVNARTLGRWLSRNEKRIVSGRAFVRAGASRTGTVKWRVQVMQGFYHTQREKCQGDNGAFDILPGLKAEDS